MIGMVSILTKNVLLLVNVTEALTKRVESLEARLPKPMPSPKTECAYCNGRGRYPYPQTCKYCNGEGMV